MDGLADPERGIEGGDNTGEREHERCWKKRGGGESFFFFPRREIYARYPRATELHVRTYVYRGVYYSGGRTLSVRVVSSVPFPSPPLFLPLEEGKRKAGVAGGINR